MTPDRTDTGPARLRHRLHLLAGFLLLGAVAFNTAPGQVISETKLDMALNPLGFLARAVHLWDGAFFGHLQNQAYGYLFPMGPFYAFFQALDMPAWNIQRLWMTLVLCAAFAGVERVARAMDIGTPATRVLAGLAYALAPHALTLIGVNSSEFQPSAVLPWILLPLVHGTRPGADPRRAAALSALAFLFAGGINAVAVLAVLVVPLLYLLTRQRGRHRRRLLLWWLGCVGAMSMWWLLPLLVMGRYIFSFLPFIETADATTGVTSLINTLRGTSGWIAYLPVDGQPFLPAAFEQATGPVPIFLTALAAGLGLAGIAARTTPERVFLVTALLAGVVIVSAGHADAFAHPWTEQVKALLDGPLAPFRNLHKFDALIRLPLALGLAALPLAGPVRLRRPVLVASAVLAALAALPVATAGASPAGGFAEVPSYWRDATTWLNRNTGSGMVLAAPGSRRGEYLWGRPMDEPMQSLLTVRWATHTNVPWGSPGLARLIQAVDERFATGRGSPGLTSALRRIGVTYLLVRNDLARESLGTAWPARVHETLAESTGLERVATFGPEVGTTANSTAAGWFEQHYPALEVYAVPSPAPLVATVPRDGTLRIAGAPEAALALAEEGLLDDDRPTVVGDEPATGTTPAARRVVTDTLRRREIVFGDLRRIGTATLTEDQPPERGRESDLTDPAWTAATATARYSGIQDVRASSAESGIGAGDRRDPGRQPYAAFDADPRTGWRSDGWNGAVGEWLEVRFVESVDLPKITVAFEKGALGPPVAEAALETATGTRRVPVGDTADPQLLHPPAGATSWLRVRVTRLASEPGSRVGTRVGITEIAIPGVRAGRSIAVPADGAQDPGTVLLTRQGSASPCMHGSATWTCSPSLQITGEDGSGFDRTFVVRDGGERAVTGRAVLTDPVSAGLLTTIPGVFPRVTASSTLVDHPAVLGRSAMDGNLDTVWYAQTFDPHPTLTVRLRKKITISQIMVLFPDSFLGQPPVKVSVRGGGRTAQGWVGANGRVAFAPIRTDRLEIGFTAPASRPIEVSELTIPGVKPIGSLTPFPLRLPCGYGPTLTLNGNAVPTEIVDGTLGDVVDGRPLGYRACEPVELGAGTARVTAAPSDAFRIESVVVRTSAEGARHAVTATPVVAETWGPEERRVRVSAAAPSYLVVNENHNTGWQAYLDGRRLTAVRLDGWRQAWELPPGQGVVTMRYEPDAAYRAALLGGGALVLLVLVLAAVPARRLRPSGPAQATGRTPGTGTGGLRPFGPVPAAVRYPGTGAAGGRAVWIWPLAPLVGLWTGGFAGAAIVTGAVALSAWLRAVAEARHARLRVLPGLARAAASPWALVALPGLAGLALAAGTLYGGAEATEAFTGPLTGVVPQVLCLLTLAWTMTAVPRRTPALPPPPRRSAARRPEPAAAGR
ncbi:alpha-(1-_3)-arabinofuranosyltransferase domain-containing protein [Streptosporangium sp. NBC_01756]|uniref:alpha-(1->3)-arabinofuranosyltransferase domain-containing protein n=1 Tax=Streptosporangium sp. NBC_01756 TaxID=2975950 RepID=UPI002DD7B618|nr:alpha-(1->3)-arabinofuranosyltransferase family protein [Streptosporangium sp. NBC_01756]WSC83878.1 alpha-(1->3)-arabinofuranosyltransferase [Streptosporangium sp. NBC_01756]